MPPTYLVTYEKRIRRDGSACVANGILIVVDILLRRGDLERAKAALARAGFIYHPSAGMDMFLDGPRGKARDSLHIIFAGEKVRPEYLEPTPDVTASEPTETFRLLDLAALVPMKLTSFRDKDRVHLRASLAQAAKSGSAQPLAPTRRRLLAPI